MRDPGKTFGANVQAEPTCGSQDVCFPVHSVRWEEAGGKPGHTGEALVFPHLSGWQRLERMMVSWTPRKIRLGEKWVTRVPHEENSGRLAQPEFRVLLIKPAAQFVLSHSRPLLPP